MKKQSILIIFAIITVSVFAQSNKTGDNFLKNPFNLQKFKKVKGGSHSGGVNKKDYYYQPKGKGVFYYFSSFDEGRKDYVYEGSENQTKKYHTADWGGIKIITYKPAGKYQQDYTDPNETLIEVFAECNDPDLPELAFVGLDTTIVKNKLVNNFIRKDDCFLYSKDNNVLVLKLDSGRVTWLKYVRLKFSFDINNIPKALTKK